MNESKTTVKLFDAPQNFEVLSSVDGYAQIVLKGKVVYGDSEETVSVSDSVYVTVTDECDGTLVTSMTKLKIEADGSFSAEINDVSVGGPYTVNFVMLNKEKCIRNLLSGDKVHHLFVGDVFLIAGQSNAAGRGRGTMYDAPELGVSVLRNLEKWDVATSCFDDELDNNMFLTFAKDIKRKTGVPIGLIPAAVCDSPLSRWLLSENGDLYKRALSALKGKKIKGVLWYQGCRDAGDEVEMEKYLNRFGQLVSDFRRDLDSKKLPFFTFQLNRQRRRDVIDSLEKSYDGIREAQRRAAKTLENVTVLPAVDALNMSDFIHNSKVSNVMLGSRLAACVLKKLYKKGTGIAAPEICSATVVGENVVRLCFENVSEYLSDLNAPFEEYPIVIEDSLGIVPIKETIISGNTIEMFFNRKLQLPAFASGQTGTSPKNLSIDYGTGVPMLCFTKFPIGK